MAIDKGKLIINIQLVIILILILPIGYYSIFERENVKVNPCSKCQEIENKLCTRNFGENNFKEHLNDSNNNCLACIKNFEVKSGS